MSRLEQRFTMRDPQGMHARNAAIFVKTVNRFDSEVIISKDGRTASGKSMLGLLTLCICSGDRVTVTVEGSDAREALRAISALFESAFLESLNSPKPFVSLSIAAATRPAAREPAVRE